MTTEFAPMPEMDQETSDLWDEGMQTFLKKGGFASMPIKYPLNVEFDLESHLPTFTEISKLDVHVDWLVEKLLPENGITTLHAGGGRFKTFLCLQLGARVAMGWPFAGLLTKKVPVYYVDFENSLAVVCERAKILGPSDMRIWHLSNPFSPPRLDSKEEWILYKGLKPGLLIFDTLRSAQLLDENSSKDMAFVMSRLKELRERGFTILLIHHSPKADDRTYKGSTAISDLSDHTLHLEKVRGIDSDIVVNDDEDDTLPLRLGPRGKTRYERFSIFLEFKPERGFFRADDPDEATLVSMQNFLAGYFKENNNYPNQRIFQEWAGGDQMNLKKSAFRRLLKKGNHRYWEEEKGSQNSTFYRQIQFSKNSKKDENLVFQTTKENPESNESEIIEFSSFPEGSQKTQKTDSIPVFQFSKPLEGWKTEKTEHLIDEMEEVDEGE